MLVSRTEGSARNLVLVQFVPLTLLPFSLPCPRRFPALLAFFNHATSLKKSTGTARAAKRGQLIGLIAIVLHERLLEFSLHVFCPRLLSAILYKSIEIIVNQSNGY